MCKSGLTRYLKSRKLRGCYEFACSWTTEKRHLLEWLSRPRRYFERECVECSWREPAEGNTSGCKGEVERTKRDRDKKGRYRGSISWRIVNRTQSSNIRKFMNSKLFLCHSVFSKLSIQLSLRKPSHIALHRRSRDHLQIIRVGIFLLKSPCY